MFYLNLKVLIQYGTLVMIVIMDLKENFRLCRVNSDLLKAEKTP